MNAKEQALMAGQDIVEDNAPTRHAVRVDWFRRDPGGGTIFVMPAGGDGAAAQPVADRDDDARATYG
ncbi:MAG: hypothetical protein ACRDRR_19285 [Pseudonocardiaceae bacterium]